MLLIKYYYSARAFIRTKEAAAISDIVFHTSAWARWSSLASFLLASLGGFSQPKLRNKGQIGAPEFLSVDSIVYVYCFSPSVSP